MTRALPLWKRAAIVGGVAALFLPVVAGLAAAHAYGHWDTLVLAGTIVACAGLAVVALLVAIAFWPVTLAVLLLVLLAGGAHAQSSGLDRYLPPPGFNYMPPQAYVPQGQTIVVVPGVTTIDRSGAWPAPSPYPAPAPPIEMLAPTILRDLAQPPR